MLSPAPTHCADHRHLRRAQTFQPFAIGIQRTLGPQRQYDDLGAAPGDQAAQGLLLLGLAGQGAAHQGGKLLETGLHQVHTAMPGRMA